MTLRLLFPLLALALLTACPSERSRPPGRDAGPGVDGGPSDMCSPGGPARICVGATEVTCNPDGTPGGMRDCSAEGLVCAADIGCATCQPGRGSCDGQQTRTCRADGSGYDLGPVCDPAAGESCNPSTGHCSSPCADAAASNSYIGCEYWPTPVLNSNVSSEFDFAVVVANPQAVDAMVTVTRGGSMVATRTIPAGGIDTITLEWVTELKGAIGGEASALVRGGAYRLRSTVPVTVYQFNALDYRIARDCPDESFLTIGDGQCFSFTNDASLLLPTHVLTGNYMALSRPAMLTEVSSFGPPQQLGSPGFFAVIGVEETPVDVALNLRANVRGGSGVTAGGPGTAVTYTLNQGDVLQIVSEVPTSCTPGSSDMYMGQRNDYCTVGPDYDLTGTEIRASGRVAVISGHNCAFVPYNRWACDHLEEAMFPLEAWGKDYVISATQPLRSEPNLIRIVSGHDGNAIAFDPASVHAPATLNRGQVLEFESGEDFRVTGSEAFMVAQFLVGQDYAGVGSSGMMGQGDPAFSLGIPTEQFRDSYTFLAPATYEVSYVNVTAPSGQVVMLDGAPVSGFRDVGGTGFATARVMIPGGSHSIESSVAFGIVVYGFGSYTSYVYPGGLDFEEINVPF